MLLFLQVGLIAVLFAVLFFWIKGQRSRARVNTWDEIVSKLRTNDWGFEEISERYLYKSGINATSKDIWPRIHGASGPLGHVPQCGPPPAACRLCGAAW